MLSHVQLFATPWTVAWQALLSMEFSRQQYCSGLLFPSSGDLRDPGIKPRSPPLQADSLLSNPPGKPKNTGVGSLSFRHGIFPTQESNWGLQHCTWILYQLSYQGSPLLIPMKEFLCCCSFPLCSFFFLSFFKTMFIYLTALSLSCGMWDLFP